MVGAGSGVCNILVIWCFSGCSSKSVDNRISASLLVSLKSVFASPDTTRFRYCSPLLRLELYVSQSREGGRLAKLDGLKVGGKFSPLVINSRNVCLPEVTHTSLLFSQSVGR